MNLPNKLTLLRILLIPVFVALVEIDFAGHYLWAVAVFAIASFTDYLDGHLARKWGLVTDFGKFADPLADKILTTTAIIYLVQMGLCHPVVLIIIIAREFAVSGVRMIAAGAPGGKVIAANMWGKVKTVLQMLTILFYYFAAAFSSGGDIMAVGLISMVLCWAVALVTLLSGGIYLWQNRECFMNAK